MPSTHLATDQGMNNNLNGLLLDVRLASAVSAMADALKHAEREISIFELKSQPQSAQPASAIGKTIDRIEGLLVPAVLTSSMLDIRTIRMPEVAAGDNVC